MKKQILLPRISLLLLATSCSKEKYQAKTATDSNGYRYEYFKNDPLNTRIYTLENGLKVYLSDNKDEPRISTLITVKAGSTSDPEETTGLAHYFEHMMFKGTDEIGTLNWTEEKKLLDQVSDLFEKYKMSSDSLEMRKIYQQIDSVSTLAAEYAVTNEYDKLASSIGAKETNAGTSYDMTVYINDIPSNELQRWAELEYERFSDMVLRIFHTELETVYEEYNMYQDQDNSRARDKLFSVLFPEHPYGRMVIGLPEHLKKPSMVNIHEFAERYYVPNNMAVILCGDIDYEKTIQIIDQSFGKLEYRELPEKSKVTELPIEKPVEATITGPSAESIILAFRFDEGAGSEAEKYVSLIDMILSNSRAGLIDLNLIQQQKILYGGCSPYFLKDYGIHFFYGGPREGQTLEEVRDLLMAEVEKIKKGEFEDWMLEAVINNLKLDRMRQQENNMSNAFAYMQAFVNETPYRDNLKFLDELGKITKEDLVAFANENFKDNYAIVYKKSGPNDKLVKVDKPAITPVKINREDQSEFFKNFTDTQPDELEPMFVDFQEKITKTSLGNGLELDYIQNPTNEIFSLLYILDMGKNHNLHLPLAVNYLPFLGTDKYSPAELQQEFYRIGISTGVSSSNNRTYISISGLENNLEQGIELFEHLLANVKSDEQAYKDYIDGILKKRQDQKLNQNSILWGGMFNYGKYGPKSSFTTFIPEDELREINPQELTDLIKDLYSYEHRLFYYGKMSPEKVKPHLEEFHKIPVELKEYPAEMSFAPVDNEENKVFIVDYDMVQANIILMAKDEILNMDLLPEATLFSEYFGTGLSSIVFQEIREARALAYSAFASYNVPALKDEYHFVYGFVGTQADKLKTATDALLDLMNNMPKAEKQFSLAKETIRKQIQTERITRQNIYYTYLANLDRGVSHDTRKDVYEGIQDMSLNDLENFFNEHIAGNTYTFLILADEKNLDMGVLKELGRIEELSLEEIFGY